MEKEKEARKPDFTADGVAVWTNVDKNGNPFLSIKIIGHTTIFAFKQKEVDKNE